MHISIRVKQVVPYNAQDVGRQFAYFGVGIGAIAKVAKQKGYTLVYCDNHGVTVFYFVTIWSVHSILVCREPTEDVHVTNFYNKDRNIHPDGKDDEKVRCGCNHMNILLFYFASTWSKL